MRQAKFRNMAGVTLILFVFFSSCSSKSKKEKAIPPETYDETYGPAVINKCQLSNLSNQFNLEVRFSRYPSRESVSDSGAVEIKIMEKSGKILDRLTTVSLLYSDNVFRTCDEVISYSTGVNIKKEIVNGQYGDLVIADFNFDGKDDIAVIKDAVSNSGSMYKFYVQDETKSFIPNNFLTDSVSYFPAKINRNTRTLTILVAGMTSVGEHIYEVAKDGKQWHHKSYRSISGNEK